MKHLFLLSFCIAIFCNLNGQNVLFGVDSNGEELYTSGSKLIEIGDYKGADSLLTLALCSFKNENVYFNRAISRLLQYDTLGFCADMNIAANKYFDKQAEINFIQFCCTQVDTIFYDKKLNVISNSNYRYYEIIKILKYEKIKIGTFHDIKHDGILGSTDYGCDGNLLGLRTKSSDMIAMYEEREGNKRYYSKTTKKVSVKNITKYKDILEKARMFLNSKYGSIKADNNLEKVKIYFNIFVSANGDIDKVEYIGIYPELYIEEIQTELEEDLLDIVKHYPKFTPAKFLKENVNYVGYDFIEY